MLAHWPHSSPVPLCRPCAAWTKTPGLKLPRPEGGGPRVIELVGSKVVFCFTDGHGRWDSNHGDNYTIQGSGTYAVAQHRVEKRA